MISMFLSATAQHVGWPEYVYACIQRSSGGTVSITSLIAAVTRIPPSGM